jgi:hypothetical protein
VQQITGGNLNMRQIWMGCSVVMLLASTAPGVARDYPWCAREPGKGGSLQCQFMTLQQCQATTSGLGGDCAQNPAMMAYGQPPGLQSSLQDGPPIGAAPHRPKSRRVRHQSGKHGWYYE